MLIQYSYFNIRYSNINRMKLSSFPIKERGTKCPFVRLLDMKKKERMKSKRLRDSILSPFFHSYIFAMYKNEALWI